MCTVLLPSGENPIAVNKYIIYIYIYIYTPYIFFIILFLFILLFVVVFLALQPIGSYLSQPSCGL